MSNIYDVVAEDGLHPSAVMCIWFVFEETVSEGLAVCLKFNA
jgi:hypothetical protein